eukprot:scaffold67453_cov76-Cyclotella_meneghiniana.AAC.2
MSTAVPGSNTMDRGAANPVLEAHIASAKTLSIRQTRKGWCQECLGCEAKDEFKFFKEGEHMANRINLLMHSKTRAAVFAFAAPRAIPTRCQ